MAGIVKPAATLEKVLGYSKMDENRLLLHTLAHHEPGNLVSDLLYASHRRGLFGFDRSQVNRSLAILPSGAGKSLDRLNPIGELVSSFPAW